MSWRHKHVSNYTFVSATWIVYDCVYQFIDEKASVSPTGEWKSYSAPLIVVVEILDENLKWTDMIKIVFYIIKFQLKVLLPWGSLKRN